MTLGSRLRTKTDISLFRVTSRSWRTAMVAAVASLAAIADHAQAQQVFEWTGAVDWSFSNEDNWSPKGIPGVSDITRFQLGGQVDFSGDFTNDAFVHLGGQTFFLPGAVDSKYQLNSNSVVSGGTLVIDASGANLLTMNLMDGLNISGTGEFQVRAGQVVQKGVLTVGDASAGTATIIGVQSLYVNESAETSVIGQGVNGAGHLSVQQKAVASFDGTLQVAGQDSTSGQIQVLSGGALATRNLRIGDGSIEGQSANVEVAGGGSVLQIQNGGSLSVGSNGLGAAALTVKDNGTVQVGTGLTEVQKTGDVAVGDSTGSGQFLSQGSLHVLGGTFKVRNFDSFVKTSDLLIQGGIVSIDDGANVAVSSIANDGYHLLTIGQDAGTGSLTIENGGLLETDGSVAVGYLQNANGMMTVRGTNSTFGATETVYVGYDGTGTVLIEDGAQYSASTTVLGSTAGSSGSLTVQGPSSQLTSALFVGSLGTGTVIAQDRATVDTSTLWLGDGISAAVGNVTISGEGTQWTSANALIGSAGTGTLSIDSGATYSGTTAVLGESISGRGTVSVSGPGSRFDLTQTLQIGKDGQGEFLLRDGAAATSTGSYIGFGGFGSASIQGTGTVWENVFVALGRDSGGQLDISEGAVVFSENARLGETTNGSGNVIVRNTGSRWNLTGNMLVGHSGLGRLDILDGGKVASANGFIGYNPSGQGLVQLNGPDSDWTMAGDLSVGYLGTGILSIGDGATVHNGRGFIGQLAGEGSLAAVSGAGSTWNNHSALIVGDLGQGELRITDGGMVTSSSGFVAKNQSGVARVNGVGSRWDVSSTLWIGSADEGRLNIQDGGQVSNVDAYLGSDLAANAASSMGTTLVEGNGSLWQNTGNLNIGLEGQGDLQIREGGTVSVGSQLRLGQAGSLHLQGGTLRLQSDALSVDPNSTTEFLSGTLSLAGDRTLGLDQPSAHFFGTFPEISTGKTLQVDGTATLLAATTLSGGTLSVGNLASGANLQFEKGTLQLNSADLLVGDTGVLGDVIQLGSQQTLNVLQQIHVQENGLLALGSGSRLSTNTLNNWGHVSLEDSTARLTTAGQTFVNHGLLSGAGRIEGAFQNATGGVVELEAGKRLSFDSTFENLIGGRLTGRGQLVAPEIQNQGELLFSGGFTDIHAPIINVADSKIIVTGGSTSTFFGDIEVQGDSELRVSALSNAVFFDHVQLRNGAILSGDGNAYFEGSLGIGNSPSRQEFSFDVTLGADSNLIAEIAGTDPTLPEFDQYIFLKNLTLQGGTLTVDLIGLHEGDPDYAPQLGDQFGIFEVRGDWEGQFGNYVLPELNNGLRWNLSQLYSNGVLSISAVPEPGSGLGLAVLSMMFLASYRRRSS